VTPYDALDLNRMMGIASYPYYMQADYYYDVVSQQEDVDLRTVCALIDE